jgi:NADH:ubiquinone oxidoreductase subunit 4 (subunit M)
LTITILIPLVGAVAVVLIPREREAWARPFALFFSLITFLFSLL